jgi:hypothetical protein
VADGGGTAGGGRCGGRAAWGRERCGTATKTDLEGSESGNAATRNLPLEHLFRTSASTDETRECGGNPFSQEQRIKTATIKKMSNFLPLSSQEQYWKVHNKITVKKCSLYSYCLLKNNNKTITTKIKICSMMGPVQILCVE